MSRAIFPVVAVMALVVVVSPDVVAAAGAAAGDPIAGKTTYFGKGGCTSCHGLAGRGDTPIAQGMNPNPGNLTKGVFKFDADKDGVRGTDADLKLVVRRGTAAYGGSPSMPARPELSDKNLEDLVAYIRTLAPTATPAANVSVDAVIEVLVSTRISLDAFRQSLKASLAGPERDSLLKHLDSAETIFRTLAGDKLLVQRLIEAAQAGNPANAGEVLLAAAADRSAGIAVVRIEATRHLQATVRIGELTHCLSTASLCGGRAHTVSR